MQRIATLTALVAIAGAAAVAFSGTFAPEMTSAAAAAAAETGAKGADSTGAGGAGLDRNSAGILAGAFVGAAVALLSHTLVATALKLSTEAAFKALTVGFFAKCIGAILPWGALTYLPQVGRLADPIAYLVAFAIVVVLVLGGGLFDHLATVNSGALDAPSHDASAHDGHVSADKSPSEIEGRSSDRASGSASSPPETSVKSASHAPSAATVPSSVHPLGSSDSLESAT